MDRNIQLLLQSDQMLYQSRSSNFSIFYWILFLQISNKQAYMAYKLRLNIVAEVYWLKIKTIL